MNEPRWMMAEGEEGCGRGGTGRGRLRRTAGYRPRGCGRAWADRGRTWELEEQRDISGAAYVLGASVDSANTTPRISIIRYSTLQTASAALSSRRCSAVTLAQHLCAIPIVRRPWGVTRSGQHTQISLLPASTKAISTYLGNPKQLSIYPLDE